MNRLLLDIGASNIKSVVQTKGLINSNSLFLSQSFSTKFGDKFKAQVIIDEFKKHVIKQLKNYIFDEIWLCSEMHNVVLFNIISQTYSDFISWRHVSDKSDEIKSHINKFRDYHALSGQTLHDGVPILNLTNLYEDEGEYQILTLPELITHKLGNSSFKVHSTMAASTGMLNVKNNCWLNNLICNIYPNLKYSLPQVFEENESPFLGEIKINNKNFKIYGGFGDLQTALLGSNLEDNEICINLGTGSQIISTIREVENYSNMVDIKPFFGKYIKALTHIPAGRSLNFIQKYIYKNNDFWDILQNTKMPATQNIDVNFNLNIFKSNWRYSPKNKTKIRNYLKSNNNFFEAILSAFCNEYIDAIRYLDYKNDSKYIYLSGGKLKDLKYVKEFFKNIKEYKLKEKIYKRKLDTTLLGLDILSKKF